MAIPWWNLIHETNRSSNATSEAALGAPGRIGLSSSPHCVKRASQGPGPDHPSKLSGEVVIERV